jgi:PAS domain S-box-containing protein
VSQIDQAMSSTEQIEIRLEFETLIAELSARFINLTPDEVDREIEDALRGVCELLGIDFAMLWQWTDHERQSIVPTHAHPPLSQQPSQPNAQDRYPWVQQQMRRGRTVIVRSLEDLPAEAAVDVASAREVGIKSNLTIPLVVGGEPPIGALALNTLHAEHAWPDVFVHRLHVIAHVFTHALARRRHELHLLESEERLTLAAEAAGAGLWTLDTETGVFWATPQARAIFGYGPDEVITLERVGASVHPDDRDRVLGAVGRAVEANEPIDEEYRIAHPDEAGTRWVASRGRLQPASAGRPARVMGVSIDVTQRRRDDEDLRTSQALLASSAELAGLGYYQVDFEGRGVYADRGFREICGVPPDEQGLRVLEFWIEHLHPGDRRHVMDQRERLHEGSVDKVSIEYRFRHPVHGEIWIHHLARVARRESDGQAVTTFGVVRDVTTRKRAEVQLHELSQRLIRAHEEERALIARELHDDVTQRLAVLAIDVGRVAADASGRGQAAAMGAVREELGRVSEDIHALAYQLHPAVLEELGLVEALRAECERQGRRGGLAFSVDLEPLLPVVGKDLALCLFRVTQEALNNVVRHAGARAASVTLRQMDGGVLVAVRDDGVGFDPEQPGVRMHLGLASMRERVRLVNGTLDFESAPGQGTTVVVWVPTDVPVP